MLSVAAARQRKIRLIALGLGYLYVKHKREAKVKRRYWVHPINLARPSQGAWTTCMAAMRETFPEKHRETFRMDIDTFSEVLQMVEARIKREDTVFRRAISAEQRLGVTLYYLATGDSFKTIALLFRLGHSTTRAIIFDTCQAIWECFKDVYMKTPSTAEEWGKVASDFETVWNFPNCLGAIDGKHCSVQCPPNTGSQYFNYKKFFSVVLLAACDANYSFLYIDVGTSGRWSDGGTFENCSLNAAMKNGQLSVPPDAVLRGTDTLSPYTFVGDEAFPLKTWLMRPIPGASLKEHKQKVYNYRLSRARRTIENAFGILVSRWRILKTSLHMSMEHAIQVIMACCILHNFMRSKSPATYTPPGFADCVYPNGHVVDGLWRDQEPAVNTIRANRVPRRPAVSATDIRDRLVDYLSGPGSVEWQDAYVRRTQ